MPGFLGSRAEGPEGPSAPPGLGSQSCLVPHGGPGIPRISHAQLATSGACLRVSLGAPLWTQIRQSAPGHNAGVAAAHRSKDNAMSKPRWVRARGRMRACVHGFGMCVRARISGKGHPHTPVAPEVRVCGARGAQRGAVVAACQPSCARADVPGSEVPRCAQRLCFRVFLAPGPRAQRAPLPPPSLEGQRCL